MEDDAESRWCGARLLRELVPCSAADRSGSAPTHEEGNSMTATSRWIKSTRSQNTATCVEVTTTLDEIRDSKDPTGPTLKAAVAPLVQAIKSGRFDA
ncbi:DUF397 domain-containing protein [Saccharopolyspora sp. NPDC047091]|uniref:DUF397 domain-containing protein n=1 Tax=Saccharopolyspora sp. NPDC047091 TaxID=3155924 RepID=UPI0033F5C967